MVFVNDCSKCFRRGVRGTAIITATAADGKGACDCCTVTVTGNTLVTSVEVHPATAKITEGNSYWMTVVVSPDDATNKAVTWSSDNKSIATVNANGVVTAKGVGSTKIRATAKDGTGRSSYCDVTVKERVPVTSVKVEPSTLEITEGSMRALRAVVSPSNATNKIVSWSSSRESVAKLGSRSGCVVAVAPGTATITAKTDDGGFEAYCTVTVNEAEEVDTRPVVTVVEDNEGAYDFFKVTFPSSEGGLVWKSIGMELEGTSPYTYQHHWNRYYFNQEQAFNENQLAFLYLLDPLGIMYYMKNNISHRFTGDANYKVYQTCMFKDRVYTKIFGTYPRLIKVFPNDRASYFEYNPHISQEMRLDFYTDAEFLFGGHNIYDWLAVANLVLNYGVPIVSSLFATKFSAFGNVLNAIDLCNFAFFSGAINNTLSSGTFSSLDEYLQLFITDNNADNGNKKSFSKTFSWLTVALSSIVSIVEGLNVFTPTMDEVITYDKINRNDDYRVTLKNGSKRLTIQELVEYCEH